MSSPRYFVVKVWPTADATRSFQASARAVEEPEARTFAAVEDLCRFLVAAAEGIAAPAATVARGARS